MSETPIDGLKKLSALFAGGASLAALPPALYWPVVVMVSAYLVGQSAVDVVKAWRK